MSLGLSKGSSRVLPGQVCVPCPLLGKLQGQLRVLGSPWDQLHVPGPHGGAAPRPPGGNSVSQAPLKGSRAFQVGAAAIPRLLQDESLSRLQPRASMSLLMWEIILSHSSSSEGTDCSSELPAAPVPLEAEVAPRERR